MPVRSPSFLIVGTARSGTTLAVRLAQDLRRVGIGPETHFWSHHAIAMLRRRVFPLQEDELLDEVRRYLEIPSCRGLDVDADAVVGALDGWAPDPFALFAAIVGDVTGGAPIPGEKTPEHLLWWRPLTSHWPQLRIVWLLRDPRAVVASNLDVPFGMVHVDVLAERWRADQEQLRAARAELGERLAVIDYDDMVDDPDATTARLAELLDTEHAPRHEGRGAPVRQTWESWKSRSEGPVDSARAHAWRDRLSADEVATVEAACADLAEELGVLPGGRLGPPGAATVGPRGRLRVAHYRRSRRRLERRIARLASGASSTATVDGP